MEIKIACLAGDGIGPEITSQALKVLDAIQEKFGHRFEVRSEIIGACAIRETGQSLPKETLQTCLDSDAVLLGAIGDPAFDNDPSAKIRPEQGLLALRKALKAYANIRPVQSYKALESLSPLKGTDSVDMTIYRELTGGIYFGTKKLSEDGRTASDLCEYSYTEVERIARKAFEAAGIRRGKLTLVDKANVLETSRLWRSVVKSLCKEYPDVEVDYMFIDNAAMQMLLNPKQFDVILTENMFGDILSDEASAITGSLGMLPSASVGDGVALFEPVHGSYPQAAGLDVANPMAMILSTAMLMDHFSLSDEAAEIRSAVDWALSNGIVTQDINNDQCFGTSRVGDLIALRIVEGADANMDLSTLLENSWMLI